MARKKLSGQLDDSDEEASLRARPGARSSKGPFSRAKAGAPSAQKTGDQSESESSSDTDSSSFDQDSKDKNLYTVQWDGQEQASILECYGLDELFPKSWTSKETQVDIITSRGNVSATAGASLVRSSPNLTGGEEPIGDEDELQKSSRIENSGVMAKAFYVDLLRADKRDPLNLKALPADIGATLATQESELALEIPAESSILLNSKMFDAKLFLKTVHQGASYKDLLRGLENLKAVVEKRNETIKLLVKTNFAKFVSSKSTIDAFYKEMKSKNLTAKEEFGTRLVKRELATTNKSAQGIFGAMIERQQTARHVGVAKAVLEQCKFFFNLPFSIRESFRRGKLDAAIRSYKKGKNFFNSRLSLQSTESGPREGGSLDLMENTLDASSGMRPNAANPSNLSLAQMASTQKAFKSVWEDVARVAGQLREALIEQLRDPDIEMDQVETVVLQLADLDMETDPISLALEIFYLRLLDHLKSSFQIFSANTDLSVESTEQFKSQGELKELRELVFAIQRRKEIGHLAAHNFDVAVWSATTGFLNSVRKMVAEFLPRFQRIAKLGVNNARERGECNTQRFGKDMVRDLLFHLLTINDKIFCTNVTTQFTSGDSRRAPDFDATELEHLRGVSVALDAVPQINIIESSGVASHRHQGVKRSAAAPSGVTNSYNSLLEESRPTHRGGSPTLTFPTVVNGYQLVSTFGSRLLSSCFLVTSYYSIQVVSCQSLLISELERRLRSEECSSFVDDELLDALVRQAAQVQTALLETQNRLVLKACERFYRFEDWCLVVNDEQHKELLEADKLGWEVNSGGSGAAAKSAPSQFGQTLFLKFFYCVYKLCCESSWRISLYSFNAKSPKFYVDRTLRSIKFGESSAAYSLPKLPSTAASNSKDSESGAKCALKQIYNAATTYFNSDTENLRLDPLKSTLEDRRDFCRQSFIQGLYLFIDGMHYLSVEQTSTSSSAAQDDSRLLVLAANLSAFRSNVLPPLFALYENLFHYPLGAEALNVMDAAVLLDSVVLDTFIKRKYLALDKSLRQATLFDGFDWEGAGKPTQVRPFLMNTLLSFVLVQSQVQKVTGLSSGLPSRAVSQLVTYVAQSMLKYVRQIDRFSLGGSTQLLMELQLFEKVMGTHCTIQVTQLFALARAAIESQMVAQEVGDRKAEEIKKAAALLTNETLLHTNMLFSCFQKPNPATGSPKSLR